MPAYSKIPTADELVNGGKKPASAETHNNSRRWDQELEEEELIMTIEFGMWRVWHSRVPSSRENYERSLIGPA